ncbi:MAG: polysaccharide deacetylase family protein [Oscillospiraceae bacterium]|nr:polysaccharide deacetylase family protein [Oscillospiraceae bacterium]
MNHKKYAVFTMDVETFSDTECIYSAGIQVDVDLMDGLDEYLNILNKYQIKSTLFTVGDLAPRIADRLRSHIRQGHKIALHSYSHIAPMNVSLEQFREKIRQAKRWMQELLGVDVVGFRAPCFSIDKDRLDVLKELGFLYDSSFLDFQPARHTVKLDLQNFKQLRDNIFRNGNFYEFGLSKEKILGKPFPISGGGYVRLSNWGFIKTLIQHHIHHNDYYVFYLHPFELTKQQIPFLKELKSYDKYYIKQGIRTYGRRIEQIILMLRSCGYEFVTFEQLVQIMDKEACGAD